MPRTAKRKDGGYDVGFKEISKDPDTLHPEDRRVWNEGRVAQAIGLEYTQNPYPPMSLKGFKGYRPLQTPKRLLWFYGWFAQKRTAFSGYRT